MPLFGVTTEKEGPFSRVYKNTYYVETTDLSQALTIGQTLINAEQVIFGETTTFTKVRVWEPNQSPPVFITKELSLPGTVSATQANPDFQVLRIYLNASIGYGGYKDYRVCVADSYLTGEIWASTYGTIVGSFLNDLNAIRPVLRTRRGGTFTSVDWEPEVKSRQLNNRWYNRASS